MPLRLNQYEAPLNVDLSHQERKVIYVKRRIKGMERYATRMAKRCAKMVIDRQEACNLNDDPVVHCGGSLGISQLLKKYGVRRELLESATLATMRLLRERHVR